ncbi:carbonic anhydrase 2-like [Homalodisca vitripennis]|nr:carbonic anhydrase 2-like [Homalodisca vitripennis]
MPAVLLLVLLASGCTQAWKYSEFGKPEGWAGKCIDGQSQSPIDLVTETAHRFVVEPLEFFNYKSLNGTITNNGHSVAIHFDEDHCDSGVTAGLLKGMYILHELHFHWSSEHTVNGKRFPLELHMVHYNQRYGDLKHAAQQHDGLAVVGILFEESENGTEVLEPLLRVVRAVSGKVQAKERLPPNFNPIEFLPADRSTFFRYQGSLTTPPCSETVKWTVMQSKVPISSDQIKTFRQVSSESGKLEHNYRRLQEINKRDVYLLSDNGACATSAALSVTLFSVFVVLLQYR